MKAVRRVLNVLILLAAANVLFLLTYFGFGPVGTGMFLALLAGLVFIAVRPMAPTAPTKRIRRLANGCELLRLFLISATVNVVWMLALLPSVIRDLKSVGYFAGLWALFWGLNAVGIILVEAVVFWSGMIRVYITSVQLGLKHRVLAALCGWIPFLNLWYLRKIIRITSDEVEFETEKWELDAVRAESEICKTKYPLLLVHGVFFRDFRYVNYWGRIPRELTRNGAAVYYGQQQSAAAVEDSGRELAERIRQIIDETGCEKVNIIAHSKGGLEARFLISAMGWARHVASLTMLSTPNRGSRVAEALLRARPGIALWARGNDAYWRRHGDERPDTLRAGRQLTPRYLAAFNRRCPDAACVYYQSWGARLDHARADRAMVLTRGLFYPLHGESDGLVTPVSARWGRYRGTLRGVSHQQLVDAFGRDTAHFSPCRFYAALVHELGRMGL